MRATYLQFRNPKEQTPDARLPLNTNQGKPMTLYTQANQSESKKGSFSRNERFKQGSIYKDVVDRTKKKVGPGAYMEEQVVHLLKSKPCMTTIQKPTVAQNE